MKKLSAADIPVRDFPIDEVPHLKLRLGKAGADRIRYHQQGPDTSKLPNSTNLINTAMQFMQGKQPGDAGCWVDDIIQGVARLDHHQSKLRPVPLNVDRLYAVLQCMEVINTREVMKMLGVDKRQAQKYVKAVKLVLTAINRELTRSPVDSDV
jgi:hypothetical protein